MSTQVSQAILTVAGARRILRGPLRFGDQEQIRAADLLDLLEEAFRLGMAVRKGRVEVDCAECLGKGSRYGRSCLDCRGFGTEEVELESMDEDLLRNVIDRLEQRKRA